MIYTVTFSPAIDYVVYMDDIIAGETNRTLREDYFFGGKGINVSSVLTELGIANTAMGFLSGFTGRAIEEGLHERGIMTDFIYLDSGISRINIKIKTLQETEINAQGPVIAEEELQQLIQKLALMKKGDMLIISGSVPNTMPDDTYERIIKSLSGKDIEYVVDATGELLKSVLKYKPFLIKPNRRELEELVGYRISSEEKLKGGAVKLQEMGAKNVLVSLGSQGAYLLCENGEEHRVNAIKLEAYNTVGAGDSMVAGFVAGYMKKRDYLQALMLGNAAGAATAASHGLATKEKIEQLYQREERWNEYEDQ